MIFLIEKINEFLQPLYDYLLNGLTSSLNNNIIDGELLRINLSWAELPTFTTTILVALFILFVIKIISKILGVFIWR